MLMLVMWTIVMIVVTHEHKGKNEWILDTKISFHMTLDNIFFYTYERIDEGSVTMGKNATWKVGCVGSVNVKMFNGTVMTFTDVGHDPSLNKKLISLGTLDKNECMISCEIGVIKVIRSSIVVMKENMNEILMVFVVLLSMAWWMSLITLCLTMKPAIEVGSCEWKRYAWWYDLEFNYYKGKENLIVDAWAGKQVI